MEWDDRLTKKRCAVRLGASLVGCRDSRPTCGMTDSPRKRQLAGCRDYQRMKKTAVDRPVTGNAAARHAALGRPTNEIRFVANHRRV